MFGDYEAQRHWQEVTYNLPVHEWFVPDFLLFYSIHLNTGECSSLCKTIITTFALMWSLIFFSNQGILILQIMTWTTGGLTILHWQPIIVSCAHMCKFYFILYIIPKSYFNVTFEKNGYGVFHICVIEQNYLVLNGWNCMHLEVMKATLISCSWGQQVGINLNY